MYLTDEAYQTILADISQVVTYYDTYRDAFVQDLGMQGLSETAVKAAWCSVVANGLKPYGPGPASTDLAPLLESPTLACNHYVTLTWYLLEEFQLSQDNLTAVGWDAGIVGNHAQMLYQDADCALLLDPTLGLVVKDVTFTGLINGQTYSSYKSFYSYDPSYYFLAKVIGAVTNGDYHFWDAYYKVPTFDNWVNHYFDYEGVTIENGADSQSMTGSLRDDRISSGVGDDIVYALKGNDVINGGAGADQMYGGLGNDSYYIDNVGDVAYENLNEGLDTVYFSTPSYTLGDNIENAYINTAGPANATGNALNNVIYAGAGDNVMNGGAGNDTVSYYYSAGRVSVSLSVGAAQNTLGSGNDTLIGIENLVGSNVGDDSLVGSNEANVIQGMGGNDAIYGLGGNDALYGGAGNDSIEGGAGADQMYGGLGNDSYYIDNVGDVAYENLNEGLDTVYFSTPSYTLGDNIENAYINTAGPANATGNALNNVIYAGAGDNVMNGGAGNDTVSYYYSAGRVSVSLSVGAAQNTLGSGNDTLIGIENLVGSNVGDDSLVGSNEANVIQGMGGNDAIYGLGGNDALYGGAGNDSIEGGAGADQMYGGSGSDIFYFGSLDEVGLGVGQDSIADFDCQFDRLDFTGFDADSVLDGKQAFSFLGTANFSGEAGQLRLDSGTLWGDVSGDMIADFGIKITMTGVLADSNFIL